MRIEFTHPWMLSALALIPVVWWSARRTLTDFSRGQLRLMSALRTAILVLLVLALAAPTLTRRSSRIALSVLVDTSPSMSEEGLARADALVKRLVERTGVPLRIIAFDRSPRVVYDGAEPLDLDRPLFVRPDDDNVPAATDIDAALRFARAGLPSGYAGQIALITDGRQTAASGARLQASGTAEETETATGGCPTSLVALVPPPSRTPEVLVAGVEIEGKRTPGATVELKTRVFSRDEGPATLTVYADGFRIGEPRAVTLRSGENVLTTPVRLASRGGTQTYSVRVDSPLDTYPKNNRASQVAVLPGELKVLLVEQTEDDARFLARVLREGGLDVEVRTPTGFPTSLSELDRFACVVLSDVPAPMLTIEQMRMVKRYVEDLGGGLVMIGGEDSFGLGGWFATPVEEVLPVALDVEKKKEQPTLAMMLLLDKSGSMMGGKLELAKDAAVAALELLGPDDLVGVVTFDAEDHLVMAPRRASERMLIRTTLSGLTAGGGTNICPALETADRELRRVDARLKHVILLTDGQTAGGDYRGLLSRLSSDRITVSTVAVGARADADLLKDIARWGRGRFYFTQDAFNIPQIFARETMTASRSAILEEPFRPRVVRRADVISGLDFTQAPYLLGYVSTRPKPAGEMILATERAEPLLIRGRFGLGKSVAFTSDAKNRWAAEWLSWPGFAKLWTQTIRDVMRPRPTGRGDVLVTFRGDVGSVEALVTDPAGRFRNRLNATTSVVAPDGRTLRVPLTQSAPGCYHGDFPAATPGVYAVSTMLSDGTSDRTDEVIVSGAVKAPPAEFTSLNVDRRTLSRLVGEDGSIIEPDDWSDLDATVATLTAPSTRGVSVVRPLWPVLLWTAFGLFFVDLVLRRFDLRNLRAPRKAMVVMLISGVVWGGGHLSAAPLTLPSPGGRGDKATTLSGDPELAVIREQRAASLELLARVLMSQGKLDEAKKLLSAERERILRTTPEHGLTLPDAKLLYLLGIVGEMSGQKDALPPADLDRLSPISQDFHLSLGMAFAALHREDVARREFETVLRMPPDDSLADLDARSRLLTMDLTNREYASAAKRAEKLSAMIDRQVADPVQEGFARDVKVGLLLSQAWVKFEAKTPADVAQALALCEQAWRLDPHAIDPCVLGERLAAAQADPARRETLTKTWRERSDAVAEHYRQAARLDPRDATAFNSLAWLCAELGRNLDEGIAAAKRALALQPEQGAFLDTLAELQFKKGDAAEAVRTISRVIDTCPWANDYYHRQLVRFRKGLDADGKDGAE